MATAPLSPRRYRQVRHATEELVVPLSPEDCVVQSMDDASPAKWHLGHTTWFFETFVIAAVLPDYKSFHPDFRVIFNSYYNTVGEQHPRPRRGLLTRPPLEQVQAYRRRVDEVMETLLEDGALDSPTLAVVELGLHHEQQHQELLLMDIKHALAQSPLHPAYRGDMPAPAAERSAPPLAWISYEGGVRELGHQGPGFCYDNELPRHQRLLSGFALANRPVTNGEFLEFMADGGYRQAEFWLADGWATVQQHHWHAPLYWQKAEDVWRVFTLTGLRDVHPSAPVTHVSYYEADAYARWAGARLPEESEWEHAAAGLPVEGHFMEGGRLHPAPAGTTPEKTGTPLQIYGDVWEWTRSAYAAYPGYAPPPGAIGEYNGKFMCNQMVMRGGCCISPSDHLRPTYRNFFYPHMRWQFGGIRLARDSAS